MSSAIEPAVAVSDTPRQWCPGCEPECNEITDFLEVVYCGRHLPSRDGLDDAGVVLGGEVISEGAQQRAFCALVHRSRAEGE